MQDAETVLGVIRERGRCGLPPERLYRQLFNPQLFLRAYGRLYANKGAMTPGVTRETVDGMSLAKIDAIIGRLRSESYRWSPARRVYLPKKNRKWRPLGMPTWSDKPVAEVVRLLLEAYDDIGFSDRSHGFRPGRGCHTALREVAMAWTGTHWFIEGDISDCFGSLKHRSTVAAMARAHQATITTADGPPQVLRGRGAARRGRRPLVARFGGIPLIRKRTAVLADRQPTMTSPANELIRRLMAGECELCEARSGLEVHHLRKLADLNKPGQPDRPPWVVLMARRKRKTLVVCSACHHDIHAGRGTALPRK
jgi:Reverse transcriptase (RNA-dependent DNA polymerase)